MMRRLMINERIEELAKRPFFKMFPKKVELLKQRKCTECETDIDDDEFTHPIQVNEYLISGMCMKCQRKVFDEPKRGGECYYHWCENHCKDEPLCCGECNKTEEEMKEYEKRRQEESKH